MDKLDKRKNLSEQEQEVRRQRLMLASAAKLKK